MLASVDRPPCRPFVVFGARTNRDHSHGRLPRQHPVGTDDFSFVRPPSPFPHCLVESQNRSAICISTDHHGVRVRS